MATKKETTAVRKEQITMAALNIIGTEGVQGLTTASIARVVGISEANLYRHFKNKDAILTAIFDDIETRLLEFVLTVNAESIPPLEKLERIFKFHLSLIRDNRGIARVVFSSETLFREDLRQKLSSLMKKYLNTLTEILDKGVKDKSLNSKINSAAVASMFIGMIQYNALRWMVSGFTFPLLDESEPAWTEYKKMILACKESKG